MVKTIEKRRFSSNFLIFLAILYL